MDPRYRLVRLLADGETRSGRALASASGMSRDRVARQLRTFAELGLEVEALPGHGYRLTRALELLDAELIRAELPASIRAQLCDLQVFPEIDSTNRYLLAQPQPDTRGVRVCLAERQTAGRGRRGRSWFSPFGRNLYMSVLRSRSPACAALLGLSLAMGVAVARAVSALGVVGVGLKWPNDILLGDGKLGGVLIEIRSDADAAQQVVTGIGINVDMSGATSDAVDQTVSDLMGAGYRAGRNRLAARVLSEVLSAQARFEAHGFRDFHREWQGMDRLQGREVVLTSLSARVRGRALGVDDDGALLLDVNGARERIVSGEVSLRIAAQAGVASGAMS